MNRSLLSFGVPLVFTGITVGLAFWFFPQPHIHGAIAIGFVVAFVQASLSVGLMQWTWEKKSFYWVWGGGFFFRIVIFALTAYVVYRYTNFSLAWTLISLALATMIFLVVESTVLFWNRSTR